MRASLLAVDLDGTLLDDNRVPQKDSVVGLHRFLNAGGEVALASGRGLASLKALAKEIGIAPHYIASNGAHVETSSGETKVDVISKETVARACEVGHVKNLHLVYYTDSGVLQEQRTYWGEVYQGRERVIEVQTTDVDTILSAPITKMIFVASPEEIQSLSKDLSIETIPNCTLTESEPEYLEVMPQGINKAVGLARLADLLNVPVDKTAAIGDYLNDLEMVQWARLSAAMANGHPTLIRAAKLVTRTNVQGGVGLFVDYLVGNQQE